jgi:voltage-gated potassium channel Kch
VPKALALIAGSSLAPEALTDVRKAFDNAWAEIAGKFVDVAEKEAARLRLAAAILSVATNDNRDVETLKQAGLLALARDQP